MVGRMIVSRFDQKDQRFLLILAPTYGCEKNRNGEGPESRFHGIYSVSDSIAGEISRLPSLTPHGGLDPLSTRAMTVYSDRPASLRIICESSATPFEAPE